MESRTRSATAQLVWHKRGPWRQIVASKAIEQANFPAPHYTLFALEPGENSATMVAAKAIKRKVRKSAAALGKIAAGPPATSAA